jgi:hypothetical protein
MKRVPIALCIGLVALSIWGGNGTAATLAAGHRPSGFNGSQQRSDIPIRVVSVQPDPSTHKVTFTLQNVGDKAITAWDVVIVFGEGSVAKKGGLGVDAYRSFAGVAVTRNYMLPGALVTATADIPEGADAATPVVAVPTAAVYADKSFVGDDQFVEMVFNRRAQDRDSWLAVVNDFEAAAANGVSLQALEAVRERMDAALSQKPNDAIRRTMMRPNVEAAIAAVRRGESPATRFKLLLDEARSNLAAATAHVR